MGRRINILLQTTVPAPSEDWTIDRFSLLRDHIASLTDPDETRHARDDQDTQTISWPNYHSGSNGDYQRITAVEPVHELLLNPANDSGVIEYFPAHPHEGAVGVPEGEGHAKLIATGTSQTTGRPFNLIVAFESAPDNHGNTLGRAIAESSFHHLVDYNWDISRGCPSFLTEPPGEQIRRAPEKLTDIKRYASNVARWLAPMPQLHCGGGGGGNGFRSRP